MSDCKNLSDEKIGALLSANNDVAFRELFNRYWEKMYIATFRVIGDESVCEDIVQDIFLDLLERGSRIEIQNVRAFLYQAVRFQVARHIKKLRFVDKRAEIIENHYINNNVEDYITSSETKSLIDQSIASLPDRCREVFYLSRCEYLSNKEIAAKLGISVLTVETHMKKSLKYLRKSLDIACVAAIISVLHG